MTRETPQGTHDTPAWLGEFERAEFERGELEAAEFERSGLDPGDLDPGPHTSLTREPVPTDAPLWPSPVDREPITVSYVKPDRDRPTESWTGTDWYRDQDGDDSTGLGPLGLVTITGRRPVRPPAAPVRAALRTRQPRQATAAGLAALVALALVSAFFAWVTAEPLWLAVGHSTAGTVTVTKCVDHGLDRRCVGTFTSADGRFTRTAVPIMGDTPPAGTGSGTGAGAGAGAGGGGERVGAPARMTSAGGHRAYVDVDAASRAAIGLALIVLVALAIMRATGVHRLPDRRARVLARLVALAGPLSLLTGMLALTY
jgi:hypothetical protein